MRWIWRENQPVHLFGSAGSFRNVSDNPIGIAYSCHFAMELVFPRASQYTGKLVLCLQQEDSHFSETNRIQPVPSLHMEENNV